MFDIALGTAGLRRETARFDPSILSFYRQAEFGTALFDVCYSEPWRTPFVMDMHKRQLLVSAGRPIEVISAASRMVGDGSRRELLGNPVQTSVAKAERADALPLALDRMASSGLLRTQGPALTEVPVAVQRAAALLIEASMDAAPYRRAAFANVTDMPAEYEREATTPVTVEDPVNYQKLLSFYRQVEMSYMYAASQDIAAAVTEAKVILATAPEGAAFRWEAETMWGKIVLAGAGDTTHGEEPTFIRIDTAGNDTYYNPAANLNPNNWVSICIDVRGSDTYLSHPELRESAIRDWPSRAGQRYRPGPASAMFGVAVLLDIEGNDTYRSHRTGLGAARFGCGLLWDLEGDDLYDIYADGQGMGKFGIGILDDGAGDDEYHGFNQVQGCGLPRGAGLLIDRAGDDVYAANDSVIDFPSPQSAEHNVSMAQGAGYGIRQDYLSGKSQSGGIGILYDVKGTDNYSCGVFGQGTGYWEGFGILWDDDGGDNYSGQWYVQGSAAHFALAWFDDAQGNDTYRAALSTSQGVGHDFSVGWMLDRTGNDKYFGCNLSLGASSAGGFGIFIDFFGDDQYEAPGISLGASSTAPKGQLRERALMLGLFMDLGGNDTYPASKTYATNGVRDVNWADRLSKVEESQLGIFWDR